MPRSPLIIMYSCGGHHHQKILILKILGGGHRIATEADGCMSGALRTMQRQTGTAQGRLERFQGRQVQHKGAFRIILGQTGTAQGR